MQSSVSDTLAGTYASALIELAEEGDALEEIAEEVADLARLLADEPSLGRLLGSPVLGADDRAAALQRIFEGRVSDVLLRFLYVVNRKGRLDALPSICAAFRRLYDEKRNIARVRAWVPHGLDEEGERELARRLGEALDQAVELETETDPSLIGGLKLRVGDRVFDGSVATQLTRMRRRLLGAGRQRDIGSVGLANE